MQKAVFYHAGCSVCADAEKMILQFLDTNKVNVEIVNLGVQRNRIPEADKLGIKSVPALAFGDQVYHINFGASIDEVRKG